MPTKRSRTATDTETDIDAASVGEAGPALASARDAPAPASFEQAVDELETIVQQMESGALSLEESLRAYARGAQLVRHCRETLSRVEQQVRVLEGEVLKPFEVDSDRNE